MNPHADSTEEFVVVMEPRDSVAASLAKGILENEGIPVLVESYQIPWYDGIMTPATGAWGRILVPARLASNAKAVLSAYFAEQEDEAAPTTDPE